jgi:hypothetical protein
MSYAIKTIFIIFYLLLYCILVFSCVSYNSTINTKKFKSFVEVYPIEGNRIEVYPIEAYLIGKGVVEVSGCSRVDSDEAMKQGNVKTLNAFWLKFLRSFIASSLKFFTQR